MVAFPRTPRLTVPVAPLGAVLAALVTILLCLAVPGEWIESLVVRSGLPSLLAAAEPPLGRTARLALAVAGGAGAGLTSWAALFLLFGGKRVRIALPVAAARDMDAPVVRRADAHPDAPPRRPIRAERDLGTPFLDIRAEPVAAERTLPRDLATPLAAYDPRAIPAAPRGFVRAPAPLVRPAPLAPGERLETFTLAPAGEGDAGRSLGELLDRLERSARLRRSAPARPAPGGPLDEALGSLRRVAARA